MKAQRSGGPKSPQGKAIVARNAVTHGGTALVPVLPDIESAEEWEAHLSGIQEDLRPSGRTEHLLVERVAFNLWRMRRVARYETAVLASVGGKTGNRKAERRTTLEKLAEIRASRALLKRLPEVADGDRLAGEDVRRILWACLTNENGLLLNWFDLSFPEIPNPLFDGVMDWTEWGGCSGSALRNALALLAKRLHLTPARMIANACSEVERMEARLERDCCDAATMDPDGLVPREPSLSKVLRYEAHLERSTLKTLRLLKSLQAEREGLESSNIEADDPTA